MYINLIDLVDRIGVSQVNCPVPMLERAIIDAAREFCRETECHIEPVRHNISPTLTRYEFLPDSKFTKVVRLKNLSHSGRTARGVLQLDEPIEEPGVIRADAVLAPHPQARKIWSELAEEFFEAIESGALAKLYNQRGTDFFDPNLAIQERTRFQDHIHNASTETRGPRQVRQRGRRWAC